MNKHARVEGWISAHDAALEGFLREGHELAPRLVAALVTVPLGRLARLHAQDVPRHIGAQILATDLPARDALDDGAPHHWHAASAANPLVHRRRRDAEGSCESRLTPYDVSGTSDRISHRLIIRLRLIVCKQALPTTATAAQD